MRLDGMLGLPESGVYIVLDRAAALCYVNYTEHMGLVLARLHQDFRGQALELEIRSPGADTETLRLHCEHYRMEYRNMGYGELIATGRKAIQYRVRRLVAPDFRSVFVELITAKGETARVVGKFKTTGEAQEFIDTYYGSDNQLCFPVYATNSLTKELLIKQRETSGIILR